MFDATAGMSRDAPGLVLRNSSAVSRSMVRVCDVPAWFGNVLASILNVSVFLSSSTDAGAGFVAVMARPIKAKNFDKLINFIGIISGDDDFRQRHEMTPNENKLSHR